MTPLLVDEAEAGTAGWILGIKGDPADGYFFVDESHADLLWQAIVAVPGGVETGRTGSSFRFRFGGWQSATRRKRRVAIEKDTDWSGSVIDRELLSRRYCR